MTFFLETALEAAQAAGDVLRRMFPETREVKSKGLRDVVTDADFAAQRVILEVITARFPDHAILSEEGRQDIDLTAPGYTWVIDPLDGTTNYSRRFPYFSVSIGLAERGELRVGVVHDPLRRETFFAEKGQGAFVRGETEPPRPLQVSAIRDLAQAVIGVDWPRDPAARQRVVEAAGRVGAAGRTLRSLGTAALALAQVASGELDAYYHLTLFPWDVAGGALLVQEAGGQLSTPAGAPWRLDGQGVAASNGHIHAPLVETLALD
jgi:myo-inositol-1(or 4)-monophosphatase